MWGRKSRIEKSKDISESFLIPRHVLFATHGFKAWTIIRARNQGYRERHGIMNKYTKHH